MGTLSWRVRRERPLLIQNQDLARVAVGVAPLGLAQIDGHLVLALAQRALLTLSQDLARVAVGVAPHGLAQVDGHLVLAVAQRAVRAGCQQRRHNLHVPAHGRPVQRRVVALRPVSRACLLVSTCTLCSDMLHMLC